MPFLATASQQQGSNATGMLILLLPLVLIGLLFWQQRRRQKQVQRAQDQLVPGQQVSTTSGLIGTLVALDGPTAEIEAAPGVTLTFDRRAVLPSPTADPAPDAEEADDDASDRESDEPRQGS
ncbi:preprotein translocase subunit YajC [Demetria terragena]|uniref:preprotein translocase subunit YajC n=1 Tax=Demetria terragena TaxID=63959 RepID=UPI00037F43E8|nr:preprotein translocase subunit YajC [Demetria terragena]